MLQRRPHPDPENRIDINYDPRTFGLFCALNCCGYDEEGRPEGMHPLRREIRRRLAALPPQIIATFLNYFASAPPLAQTSPRFPFWPKVALMSSYALHLGSPPNFAAMPDEEEAALAQGWPKSTPILPQEVEPFRVWLQQLSSALRAFWQEAGLGQLHEEYAPKVLAAAGVSVVELSLQAEYCLKYLDAKIPVIHLVVIPNLLQNSCTADAAYVGDTTYIIEGRCPIRTISIWHELCHAPVEAVLNRNPALLQRSLSLLAQVEAPMRAIGYWCSAPLSAWRRILEETLVRAVCARLKGGTEGEDWIREDAELGFVFIEPAAAVLDELHERQGWSFEVAVMAFLEQLARLA